MVSSKKGFGDFAFIYAQLAPCPGPKMNNSRFGLNWPILRLQQQAAVRTQSNKLQTPGGGALFILLASPRATVGTWARGPLARAAKLTKSQTDVAATHHSPW